MLPLSTWDRCDARRDCSCCGANAALACVERHDHDGIHMLVCGRCGRDTDC